MKSLQMEVRYEKLSAADDVVGLLFCRCEV